MTASSLRTSRSVFVTLLLVVVAVMSTPGQSVALDVGQPAPDFKLPSTTGGDLSLSEFRGKQWVLLEFYGADFAPT